MAVIRVEFDRPAHGWMGLRVQAGQAVLSVSASAVPRDSIGDLAGAICFVLKGGPEAVVVWNEEPAEYEFRLSKEGEDVRLVVQSFAGGGRRRGGGKQVLAVSGGRLEVCRPFWRALRRLQASMPANEYRAAWGHPFPDAKMSELGLLLKPNADKQPARLSSRTQRGRITQFLRRNLFRVQLHDGQEVVAAMPQSLLHVAANAQHGLRRWFISVEVELRKPPRISRIVRAEANGLTG